MCSLPDETCLCWVIRDSIKTTIRWPLEFQGAMSLKVVGRPEANGEPGRLHSDGKPDERVKAVIQQRDILEPQIEKRLAADLD